LGIPSQAAIDSNRPLKDFGLDSLMAVELRNQLARQLQRPLPATLAFDYPTIHAIVNYIDKDRPPVRSVETQPVRVLDEGIAIVGISCRFPGNVETPADFWRVLCDGVDAIGEVPRERWDTAIDIDIDTGTRWGGFINDVDRFDAAFFGVAPREAVSMDPQQR